MKIRRCPVFLLFPTMRFCLRSPPLKTKGKTAKQIRQNLRINFIYHAGKDSQWPLNPEKIGLDSIGGSVTRSAREIYQIPAQ